MPARGPFFCANAKCTGEPYPASEVPHRHPDEPPGPWVGVSRCDVWPEAGRCDYRLGHAGNHYPWVKKPRPCENCALLAGDADRLRADVKRLRDQRDKAVALLRNVTAGEFPSRAHEVRGFIEQIDQEDRP